MSTAAEDWQHANDTLVMADMVRIGKENAALRQELAKLRAEIEQLDDVSRERSEYDD